MSNVRSKDPQVENELFLDRMIFGTSFHKIVDGRKVRIDPRDVYLMPSWRSRVWWFIKRWWTFLFVSRGPWRTRRIVR